MIALIVAYANNQVIGNLGCIPWKIKGEQKRFKELTTGNVVVMGRRSYEEIGRPLPNRMTIVISSTKNYDNADVKTVRTLREAIAIAGDKDIYISGGVRLYEEALPIIEKMYITEINLDIEGDTYFPSFDKSQFTKEINQISNDDIPYSYVTYTKR